jgi:hypothetical protein
MASCLSAHARAKLAHVDVKAEQERLDEVGALLDSAGVNGVLRGLSVSKAPPPNPP